MMMNINQTAIVLVLSTALFTTAASADQSESLLNFKFNHLTNNQNTKQLAQSTSLLKTDELNFAQFDATWTYPWESKNFNIDLGVTLRHLSGYSHSAENIGNHHFQKVLPLVHASALFSLPLKGLSAGIEGSHLDLDDNQVFDYRAKVSYEWRKGFGLQGGWQHQQFNLDNVTNTGADFEKNGPFIDFYLQF